MNVLIFNVPSFHVRCDQTDEQDVNTKIRETREHFQSFNDASLGETQYFITSIKADQRMGFRTIL